MPQDHLTLYFFSGTGNSFRVSKRIESCAKLKNHTISLIPIEKRRPTKRKKIDDNITGIIFPTHGFTAPWHVIKFAWHLPPGKGKQAFCVTTRAGIKLGEIYLPGISGSAPFGVYLLPLFTASPITNSQFPYHLSVHILNLLYFYPALILSYSLFFLLLRIGTIRYFFTTPP